MELRHLRYLVGVADASSFVRAARTLHVAQPALSRQIRDLERMLGAELLERGARGVSLTPAGAVCVAAARHILAEARAAAQRARLSSRGRVGRVVLAVAKRPTLTSSLAGVVRATREAHPDIMLVVEELALEAQWDALRAAEVDVGLGMPAPSSYPDLVSETLAIDVYDHVVLAATHPLAARERLSPADLAGETVIFPSAALDEAAGRANRAELERWGFGSDRVRGVANFGSWMSLLRAGQGITFGPAVVMDRLPPGLVPVPVDRIRLSLPYTVIYRRADARPVIHTMLDVIRAAHARAGERVTAVHEAEPRRHVRHDHFELRHLRYFAAVVAQGSFGRAGEELGVTQPALSRQIRDLENEVGVALLERAARGVTPTLAGECFHADARRILSQVERLASEVRRARRATNGRCVIGTVPTPLALRIVARTLRATAEALPGVEIEVEEVTTRGQPRALAEARIDLAIGHTMGGDELDTEIRRVRLADDALDTALLPAAHPLAGRRAIDARELGGLPFLWIRRAFWPELYDGAMAALRRAGLEPLIDGEFDGLETLWALVAEGRGWHLGSRSQRLQPPPGTAAVPLSDVSVAWGVDLVRSAASGLPLVQRVGDLVRAAAVGLSGSAVSAPVEARATARTAVAGD